MFESAPLPPSNTPGPEPIAEAPRMARWLRISILQEGRSVVQVSFPAYAVANLADLVPDEARAHVARHEVDLEHLSAQLAADGCPPGEIFAIRKGPQTVRAWLE